MVWMENIVLCKNAIEILNNSYFKYPDNRSYSLVVLFFSIDSHSFLLEVQLLHANESKIHNKFNVQLIFVHHCRYNQLRRRRQRWHRWGRCGGERQQRKLTRANAKTRRALKINKMVSTCQGISCSIPIATPLRPSCSQSTVHWLPLIYYSAFFSSAQTF